MSSRVLRQSTRFLNNFELKIAQIATYLAKVKSLPETGRAVQSNLKLNQVYYDRVKRLHLLDGQFDMGQSFDGHFSHASRVKCIILKFIVHT